MLVQLDNKLLKVGIPDVDSEVEAHTDDDLVDFAVGKFSDRPGMPAQDFARLFGIVVENLWLKFLVLEELLKDLLLFLRLLQLHFVFLRLFSRVEGGLSAFDSQVCGVKLIRPKVP